MLERDVPKGVAEGQLNLQHLMSVEIQRYKAKIEQYNDDIQKHHCPSSNYKNPWQF
jgi:hypothetical protein